VGQDGIGTGGLESLLKQMRQVPHTSSEDDAEELEELCSLRTPPVSDTRTYEVAIAALASAAGRDMTKDERWVFTHSCGLAPMLSAFLKEARSLASSKSNVADIEAGMGGVACRARRPCRRVRLHLRCAVQRERGAQGQLVRRRYIYKNSKTQW